MDENNEENDDDVGMIEWRFLPKASMSFDFSQKEDGLQFNLFSSRNVGRV